MQTIYRVNAILCMLEQVMLHDDGIAKDGFEKNIRLQVEAVERNPFSDEVDKV